MSETTDPALSETDANQVELLGIFHYVLGGLTLALSCCPLMYAGLGMLFFFADLENKQGEPPPEVIGLFWVGFSVIALVVTLVFAGLVLAAGYYLRKREKYTYCQVIAAIECLNMPLGTILGVFTLVVLSRSSVRAAFEQNSA
jgi:hypothetical protein